MNSQEAIEYLENLIAVANRSGSAKLASIEAIGEVLRLAKIGMAYEKSVSDYFSSFATIEEIGFGDPVEMTPIEPTQTRMPKKMRNDLAADIKDVLSNGIPWKKEKP